MPLTFASGSPDGAEMCAPLMALYDDRVEPEEYFTVTLTLVTTSVTGLRLGNTDTVVAVTNSEGMYVVLFQACRSDYLEQNNFSYNTIPYPFRCSAKT